MKNIHKKGVAREKNLDKDAYYTEQYFSMTQLCALSHQINEIYKLAPKNILEIGIGNGFVSDFLRKSGINVCTVDVNENLSPDVISSISELPVYLKNKKYDLVVCCEVLEHLPYEEFEKSLAIFRKYSDSLFITLPKYKKWFGFSGFISLPKGVNKLISSGVYIKRYKDLNSDHCHFWEIDSKPEYSINNITNILNRYYSRVENNTFQLCRYHEYFICIPS